MNGDKNEIYIKITRPGLWYYLEWLSGRKFILLYSIIVLSGFQIINFIESSDKRLSFYFFTLSLFFLIYIFSIILDLLNRDYFLINKKGFEWRIKGEKSDLVFSDSVSLIFEVITVFGRRQSLQIFKLRLFPKFPKQNSDGKSEYWDIEIPQRIVNRWNILEVNTKIIQIFKENNINVSVLYKDFIPSQQNQTLIIDKFFLIIYLLLIAFISFQIGKFVV
jgi:hypothetical protein